MEIITRFKCNYSETISKEEREHGHMVRRHSPESLMSIHCMFSHFYTMKNQMFKSEASRWAPNIVTVPPLLFEEHYDVTVRMTFDFLSCSTYLELDKDWQPVREGIPSSPPPSNASQLLLGDPEAFTAQMGYVIPPASSGSTAGSPPSWERPPKGGFWLLHIDHG